MGDSSIAIFDYWRVVTCNMFWGWQVDVNGLWEKTLFLLLVLCDLQPGGMIRSFWKSGLPCSPIFWPQTVPPHVERWMHFMASNQQRDMYHCHQKRPFQICYIHQTSLNCSVISNAVSNVFYVQSCNDDRHWLERTMLLFWVTIAATTEPTCNNYSWKFWCHSLPKPSHFSLVCMNG